MQRSAVVVLVAISAVDGVRYKRSSGQAPMESGQQGGRFLPPSEIVNTLKNLDPDDLLISSFDTVAGIDFGGDIGAQVTQLAINTGLSALSMVNPLLGSVFGMLAGLLDWGGVDPEEALIQKILERVDKMIQNALAEFDRKLTHGHLVELMNVMETAREDEIGTRSINTEFAKKTSWVFNSSCWSNANNCQAFYTTWGGGAALTYEIKFAQMMLGQYCDVYIRNPQADDPSFKTQLCRVRDRLSSHMSAWKTYRSNSSWFHKGRLVESGPGYTIEQGHDSYLQSGQNKNDKNEVNNEYSGPNCPPSAKSHRRRASYPSGSSCTFQQYGRRRSTQNNMNSKLQKCHDTWKADINDELNTMQKQVNSIVKSINNIMGSKCR